MCITSHTFHTFIIHNIKYYIEKTILCRRYVMCKYIGYVPGIMQYHCHALHPDCIGDEEERVAL